MAACVARRISRELLRPSWLSSRHTTAGLWASERCSPLLTNARSYCVEKPPPSIPENLRYASSHEWVLLSDDKKTAKIGITDFAQRELGDIVFVDVEVNNESLGKGETFGSLEAVKTVADLVMPCDGEVINVNSAVTSEAVLINQDPYGDGWLAEMTVSDPRQLNELLDSKAYRAQIS